MLSNTPIPPAIYNSLPDINNQVDPSDDTLRDLGRLFVEHGANHNFGISHLHRHFLLEQHEVMVHDGLRCSPASAQSLSDTGLSGTAFYLHAGQGFQAFEYETWSPLRLAEGFLNELQGYFVTNNLADRLALSRIDEQQLSLMESHEEASRTQVYQLSQSPIESREATTWRFESMPGGGIVPVITRACKRTATNDHKPPENK